MKSALITFLVLWSFLNTNAAPGRSGSKPPAGSPPLALRHATIYPSPVDAPILDGTVLIRDGKIVALGESSKIVIPAGTAIIDCRGKFVLAGFWNSHVHFVEPKWANAANQPASKLTAQLQEMLTAYGFVHVFELATLDLRNVLALRERIRRGEVLGPAISVAAPFVPHNGNPFYIAPLRLPEMEDSASAARYAQNAIDSGADAIKLWSSSPIGNDRIVNMPVRIVAAATAVAHGRGKPVFAHESSDSGLLIALNGGVDILAHTIPFNGSPWSKSLVDSLIAHHMALTPTLKLWSFEMKKTGALPQSDDVKRLMTTAKQQLGAFAKAGGAVLFGTDVGYMTEYSPEDEYRLMGEAGMDFRGILAALTTAPANRFGKDQSSGRVAIGKDADLVILSGDPSRDLMAFASVVYTIREGRVIFGPTR